MPVVRPQQIEMIPVAKITVLNPRSRNKRQHREMDHDADAAGLAHWVGLLNNGMPRGDLMVHFSESQEFKNRINSERA